MQQGSCHPNWAATFLSDGGGKEISPQVHACRIAESLVGVHVVGLILYNHLWPVHSRTHMVSCPRLLTTVHLRSHAFNPIHRSTPSGKACRSKTEAAPSSRVGGSKAPQAAAANRASLVSTAPKSTAVHLAQPGPDPLPSRSAPGPCPLAVVWLHQAQMQAEWRLRGSSHRLPAVVRQQQQPRHRSSSCTLWSCPRHGRPAAALRAWLGFRSRRALRQVSGAGPCRLKPRTLNKHTLYPILSDILGLGRKVCHVSGSRHLDHQHPKCPKPLLFSEDMQTSG